MANSQIYFVRIGKSGRLNKIKKIAKEDAGIAYIALSLPPKEILRLMKTPNAKNIFFIALKSLADEADNIANLNSPDALAEMAMLAKQVLDNMHFENKIAVIDSLTPLLDANDDTRVMEFLHFFTKRMREWGYSLAIIAEQNAKKEAVEEISAMCDKTI